MTIAIGRSSSHTTCSGSVGNTATGASAVAAVACIPTWLTDFRDDLPKIDVPVLLMQADQDRILPPANHCTGWRAQHALAAALPTAWMPASR